MMPLKCKSCANYCITNYKHEYHGCVEGCAAGKTSKPFPQCFKAKEEGAADGSMETIQ